jgi:predicted AAA+ superfamily ATPase
MIKTVVQQQKEERDLLLKENYQKRVLMEADIDFLSSPLIKLITGPRRAGKSVFALQLLKGRNFAYLNFDDELLLKQFEENEVMQQLLEIYPDFNFVLLDEIQNLPNWDIWVGKLYRRGVNLIITGSNANLLSSEMATALTGRYLQINILPFSFLEIVEYNQISLLHDTPDEKAKLMQQMNDYLLLGGFPETIKQRIITRNYLK